MQKLPGTLREAFNAGRSVLSLSSGCYERLSKPEKEGCYIPPLQEQWNGNLPGKDTGYIVSLIDH